MYYDEYGQTENPTIVFLHGAALTDTFRNQYCLQRYYHLVVPHLYGSGREVAEAYEPEKTLVALAALIRNLKKEKVTLVGHSLGGELAVALVTQYEELFDQAVFMSPWVCATQKSIDRFVRMAKWTRVASKLPFLIRLQARYWRFNKEQEDFLVEYTKKIAPDQYVAWFRDRIFLDQQSGYADVKIPMLAVCGDKEFGEIKDSVAELGKRNKNCQTIFIKNGKHDFPLRMPAITSPILINFFAQQEDAQAMKKN
jgi:pimeloyl-ACP methyl ester carboxylesterase